MSLREWLNRHNVITISVAVIVMIGALLWMVKGPYWGWSFSRSGPRAWYYDLNTSELFVASGKLTPPIHAPSGPLPSGREAGVRARVFAIGDCSDSSERFISWLEMHTPKAKAEMAHRRSNGGVDEQSSISFMDGLLVRAVDGGQWFPASSAQAKALFLTPRQKCPPGVILRPCMP